MNDAQPFRHLRIFISSPGDVQEERAFIIESIKAHQQRLLRRRVYLEPIAWDGLDSRVPMEATLSPQDAINRGLPIPSQCDAALVLFWARMGSPLAGPEKKPDGSQYLSGTEWEYWDAVQGNRQNPSGRPFIYIYRRTEEPAWSLRDAEFAARYEQFQRVERFFAQFKNPDGSYNTSVNSYTTVADFRAKFEIDLERIIDQLLGDAATAATGPRHPNSEELRRAYLQWLVAEHGRLELRGVREAHDSPTVPLEKVYVALKGDRSSSSERMQSRELLEAELVDLLALLEGEFLVRDTPDEHECLRRQILVGKPILPALVQRDRVQQGPFHLPARMVTLGEAFRSERRLVILGDPGSGKTTLARWLTIKLARALLDGSERVMVPAHQVDPEAEESGDLIDLGPARLPVLLRVADYAEQCEKTPVPLIEYLGRHPWLGQFPARGADRLQPDALNGVIRDMLRRGEAVVVLDGMDEIATSIRRDDVVRAIEEFIRDWVSPAGKPRADLGDVGLRQAAVSSLPADVGGNQVVITSRIAGYHAAPVKGDLAHVTIEPMTRRGVEHFCDTWVLAVQRALYPEADAAEVLERGEQQAAALKAAIYDPARPRVRELASNPLLVTILALVFHRRGSLPQHRADLYQLALDILVQGWRKTGLGSDELVYVLSPIAAHIHQTYATGLIQERELRELVRTHLAELHPGGSESQRVELNRKVEGFLRVVREDVGLLAARGEFLYGFLHLTFQEYLAALYLLRRPEDASAQIIAHLGSPRSREPILLALGYVGSRWGPRDRDRLLHDLLHADDPLGDLLPRTALLIATAMGEIASVSASVVQDVARRLLAAYGDPTGPNKFAPVCSRIEAALARLDAAGHADALEAVFCDALARTPEDHPEMTSAAAFLVRRQNWFTPAVAAALLEALPRDSPGWGWPINRALQALVAPPLPLPEPPEPKRLTDKEWEALRDSDPAEYQERRAYQAADEAIYQERKVHYDAARARQPAGPPAEALPFREALLHDDRLVERIKSDPAWLRLIVALYGGYFNYDAPEVLREYRDLAVLIALPDRVRHQEIRRKREYYVGRWGGSDTTYAIAVYLDGKMDGKLPLAQTVPVFCAEGIYRDSPLTGRLLAALRGGHDAATLLPVLRKTAAQLTRFDLRVDSLVALAALGQDLTADLEQASAAGQAELCRAVLARIAQVAHTLADPITRAFGDKIALPEPQDHPEDPRQVVGRFRQLTHRGRMLHALETGLPSLDDGHWRDLLSTLVHVSLNFVGQPLDFAAWIDRLSPNRRASALAEYWACRLLGGGDDLEERDFYFAAALDRMATVAPEVLLDALLLGVRAGNLKWEGARAEWVAEPLAPRHRDPSDIPPEVLDVVENLRASISARGISGRCAPFSWRG